MNAKAPYTPDVTDPELQRIPYLGVLGNSKFSGMTPKAAQLAPLNVKVCPIAIASTQRKSLDR
jgi:hypothetical protein